MKLEWRHFMRKEIVGLIQECVKNKCINPPGGEIRSIRTIERFLKSYGIEPEVFESDTERGNLYAEIVGTGDRPSLMFGPSHVDVVPVDDETTWTVPPFEGVIKDGCVWGRGTSDMLFIVACQTVVFAHLWKEGFKPRGDLKLLIVADEEAGGTYGIRYMVDNQPEKTKVDYAITEMGGLQFTPHRYTYFYGEKGAFWLKLKIKGEEQHGSMPYKSRNALLLMADAAKRISEYQPPRDISIIKRFLEGAGVGGIGKWLTTRQRLFPRMLKIISRRNLAQAKLLNALSQMTMSPNLCQSGTKVNIVPGSAELQVDIRTLPGQDEVYVLRHLKRALGPLNEEIEIQELGIKEGGFSSVGTMSDPDSELVHLLRAVIRDAKDEEADLIPMVSPGGTDARVLRQAFGTNAYGFNIISDDMDANEIVKMIHGDNERVSLSTLDETAKAYYEIAKRFLS